MCWVCSLHTECIMGACCLHITHSDASEDLTETSNILWFDLLAFVSQKSEGQLVLPVPPWGPSVETVGWQVSLVVSEKFRKLSSQKCTPKNPQGQRKGNHAPSSRINWSCKLWTFCWNLLFYIKISVNLMVCFIFWNNILFIFRVWMHHSIELLYWHTINFKTRPRQSFLHPCQPGVSLGMVIALLFLGITVEQEQTMCYFMFQQLPTPVLLASWMSVFYVTR